MRPGVGDRRHAYEDLTARARIRDAALWHFAEDGIRPARRSGTSPATAGVSPGLVRHHFGSKEGLRDACDDAVAQRCVAVNDEALCREPTGRPERPAAALPAALRPYQSYLVRALVDGSPSVAALFDDLVSMTEQWLIQRQRPYRSPMGDRRTRAALIIAMALGIPLLHDHISRALGADILRGEGERRVAMALVDLYSHPLVTPGAGGDGARRLRSAASDTGQVPTEPTSRTATAQAVTRRTPRRTRQRTRRRTDDRGHLRRRRWSRRSAGPGPWTGST